MRWRSCSTRIRRSTSNPTATLRALSPDIRLAFPAGSAVFGNRNAGDEGQLT